VVPIVHVSGTQPAFTQTPAVQTSPVAQPPQSSDIPQPSPIVPQYRAAPPEVHVFFWQLGPPTHRPPLQTLSPEQAPHSSEPPLQPLPILPQYWPPAGMQVTDGVHAASLPASVPMIGPPPVPAAPLVPAVPDPPRPVVALVPALPVAPAAPAAEGVTFAVQPTDPATTASAKIPSRRIRTVRGLPAAAQTARVRGGRKCAS